MLCIVYPIVCPITLVVRTSERGSVLIQVSFNKVEMQIRTMLTCNRSCYNKKLGQNLPRPHHNGQIKAASFLAQKSGIFIVGVQKDVGRIRGCQMLYFQTKNPNLGKF
jgi:hypothetical protein